LTLGDDGGVETVLEETEGVLVVEVSIIGME